MEVAKHKLHVAPLAAQHKEIQRLLRAGRYRNPTHFVREAIAHYLSHLGRPSLSAQAQQMAEDFRKGSRRSKDLQDASRASDEAW